MKQKTALASRLRWLEDVTPETHGALICYPTFKLEEYQSRMEELEGLRVRALVDQGRVEVARHHALGKGHVSVVAVALWEDNLPCALKIRRLDSDRPDMSHEADMLAKANAVGVGPRLYAASRNFLVLQLVEGVFLPEWVEKLKGRGSRRTLKLALRVLLEQCRQLDEINLDHGELSRAPKHVIINASDTPRIIDFETASVHRKPANVTAMCQYLFLDSQCARCVCRILGGVDRQAILNALRAYKASRTRRHFEQVLDSCSL